MIELDGSLGEGGGQILRTSLALSMITGRPFRLSNIRARRTMPDLQPQHLASVQAAAAVCGAEMRGASLQSSSLVFEPGAVKAGTYYFPIATAGALSLVLHTVYLPLALRGEAPSELHLTGGTHVKASPSFHFLDTTWRGYLALLGLQVGLRLDRLGFYPRGGGAVRALVQACSGMAPLRLEDCGPVRKVTVTSAVAGLPEHIIERQAKTAALRLAEHGLEVDVRQETWPGGPGTFVNLILDTQPVPTLFFSLGERGKPAERVAEEAVAQVVGYLASSPVGVDAHSADQLVLPLSLAEEESVFRAASLTQHLLTNVEVIGKFVEREIRCEGKEGEAGLVGIAA
jgi:RNA 3'-terminal phosphate cyclase (ATP)